MFEEYLKQHGHTACTNVVFVVTLTRIIKSVTTGQAPVTLECNTIDQGYDKGA